MTNDKQEHPSRASEITAELRKRSRKLEPKRLTRSTEKGGAALQRLVDKSGVALAELSTAPGASADEVKAGRKRITALAYKMWHQRKLSTEDARRLGCVV